MKIAFLLNCDCDGAIVASHIDYFGSVVEFDYLAEIALPK